MNTAVRSHIPNGLSVLRIGIAVGIAGLAVVEHPLWLGQVLIVAGLVSDKLDGSMARWWKVESETGKKLESIADPFFSFCSAIYITAVLDFPSLVFWISTALLIAVSCARVVFKMKYKQLFYKKSPITRGAVGLIYLVLALYVFQVPYREWLVWPVFILGCGALMNYVRMIVATAHEFRNAHTAKTTISV